MLGEQWCAFLDDIYVLCQHSRVVPIFKLLSEALERVAGIRLHQGETRVWNRSGTAHQDVWELGLEAWQPQGIKVLGTPIGTPEFTSARLRERVEDEGRLWNATPTVQDLQRGANHCLRTIPPSLSKWVCGGDHDEGEWDVVKALLRQVPGEEGKREVARQIVTWQVRMGGLGVRSASRCASCADALPTEKSWRRAHCGKNHERAAPGRVHGRIDQGECAA